VEIINVSPVLTEVHETDTDGVALIDVKAKPVDKISL